MGFGEGTTEDQDHRNRLIKVCDDFRSNNSNVSKFSDLEINTKENLYFELITECKISLDKYSSNPIAAQNLFNFISKFWYKNTTIPTPPNYYCRIFI